MAVQMGGWVSPNLPRVKFYNFTLNLSDHPSSLIPQAFCSLVTVVTWLLLCNSLQDSPSRTALWTAFQVLVALLLQCLSSSKYGHHPHFYWGWRSYFELDMLDRQSTHRVCPLLWGLL